MIKKILILSAALCGILPLIAGATPVGDIASQHVQGWRTSGIYSWNYSYDIAFQSQDLVIDIDICLYNDDPGAAILKQWEDGIEQIWSNAFDIVDGDLLYDMAFNVDWVLTPAEADFNVRVVAGNGTSNMLTWYTDDSGGWPDSYLDEIAAHEFGHMMGLYDEYPGGAVNPATGLIRPDSIMGQNLTRPQSDHYSDFLSWLSLNSGREFSLIFDGGEHHYPVPEPATILLLSSGIIGLAGARRKFKK